LCDFTASQKFNITTLKEVAINSDCLEAQVQSQVPALNGASTGKNDRTSPDFEHIEVLCLSFSAKCEHLGMQFRCGTTPSLKTSVIENWRSTLHFCITWDTLLRCWTWI